MSGSTAIPRDSAAPRAWEVDDGTGAFSPTATAPAIPAPCRPAVGDGLVDDADPDRRRRRAAPRRRPLGRGGGPDLGAGRGKRRRGHLPVDPGGDRRPGATARSSTRALSPSTSPVRRRSLPRLWTSFRCSRRTATARMTASASPSVPMSPGTLVTTVRNQAEREGGSDVHVAWLPDHWRSRGTVATLTAAYVPDGEYRIAFVAVDRAGNQSASQVRTVAVDAALGNVSALELVLYPQDGDALGRRVSLSFRLRDAAAGRLDHPGRRWRGRAHGQGRRGARCRDLRLHLGRSGPCGRVHPTRRLPQRRRGHRWHVGSIQHATVVADAFRITVSDGPRPTARG